MTSEQAGKINSTPTWIRLGECVHIQQVSMGAEMKRNEMKILILTNKHPQHVPPFNVTGATWFP